MNIKADTIERSQHDAVIFFVWKGASVRDSVKGTKDSAFKRRVQEVLGKEKFSGEKGEKRTVYVNTPKVKKVILVGLGDKKKCDSATLRRVVGDVYKTANSTKYVSLAFDVNILCSAVFALSDVAYMLAELSVLSLYRFDIHKTKKKKKQTLTSVTIGVDNARDKRTVLEAVRTAQIIASYTNDVRSFVNEPANVLTPAVFAQRIKKLAVSSRVSCAILGLSDIKREKMNGVLAVASGSSNPPKFIILKYKSKKRNAKTVCLVGKGVCFDSGGISIKPPTRMDEMKYDMAGGAVCAGVICAAARLKANCNIVALIPAVENMPDGAAYRPGDIIKTYSGLTVEVLNTDAEGRMILCDALSYTKKYKPDMIIDLATLTGAAKVCLGSKAAAIMGNDDAFISQLQEAGNSVGERMWQLPLWEDYQDDLESDTADIKHIGYKGAGTIVAGKFLSNFIPQTKWAHIDIASVAWEDEGKSYNPKGATGFGVRLLVRYLSLLK